MFLSLILYFFVGIFTTNGVPHFVKGVTKESFPCALGNGPVPNFVAGCLMFLLAGVCLYFAANPISFLYGSFIGLGIFVMGLFHAWIGAFGSRT